MKNKTQVWRRLVAAIVSIQTWVLWVILSKVANKPKFEYLLLLPKNPQMGIQIWVLFFCQSTNYLIAIRTHKTPGFPPQRKHFGISTKPKFEDALVATTRSGSSNLGFVATRSSPLAVEFVVFLSGVVGLWLLGYRIFQEKRKRPTVHSFHAHSIGPHLPTQKNWKSKIPNSGRTQSSGSVVSTYTPTSSYSYEWLVLIYTYHLWWKCGDLGDLF